MFFKNKFLLLISIFLFFANISFAQQDKMNELLDRLEKIQKDIQTLEKAVYSKNASLPSDNVVVNEALTRQLSKISELEKQIQQMTSKFEENNYKLQQLSDRLNKVSNDSQLRFQQLENNKVISEKVSAPKEVILEKTPAVKKKETNILNSEEVDKEEENVIQEKPVQSENIKLKEKVNKPKTKVLPKVSIAEQYKYAMNIMKSGDFEKAEIAFKEFVDTHSKHELAGSAQFWYGETFYIRQLYEDAAAAFLDGYQKYPNSPKASENLLKLGVTLAELGEIEQGCKMIINLKKAYPKTDAAILQKSSYEKKRFNCS
ncbi:MAG: tol-pal system protein YbgF [Alphaproteobacteria bacterium]|jgi:tol-pal system protein YbgF|nr:tol-pal system protein YbgF [Alphaproteobacteria bacterium]